MGTTLMKWTLQVSVQRAEIAEVGVAQIALVSEPIPRLLRRAGRGDVVVGGVRRRELHVQSTCDSTWNA